MLIYFTHSCIWPNTSLSLPRSSNISVRQNEVTLTYVNTDLVEEDLELVLFCLHKYPRCFPFYIITTPLRVQGPFVSQGIISVLGCQKEDCSHKLNWKTVSLSTDGNLSYWWQSVKDWSESFLMPTGTMLQLPASYIQWTNLPGIEIWWFVGDFFTSTWLSGVMDTIRFFSWRWGRPCTPMPCVSMTTQAQFSSPGALTSAHRWSSVLFFPPADSSLRLLER